MNSCASLLADVYECVSLYVRTYVLRVCEHTCIPLYILWLCGCLLVSVFASVSASMCVCAGGHRFDANTGRLVAFSYTPNPVSGTEIQVFEFEDGASQRGGRQLTTVARSTVLPNMFGLFHDFVVTKNYVVFTAAPTVFGDLAANGLKLLLGQKSPAECIEWDETAGKATMWIFARSSTACTAGEVPLTAVPVEVDAHFNFHYANAFEDPATGDIVVDTVRAPSIQLGSGLMQKDTAGNPRPIWETVDFTKDVPKSTLWRYRIKPRTVGGHLCQGKLVSKHPLCDRYLDFPVVNPRVSCKPYRYTWAATGASSAHVSPVQGIVRVDTHVTDASKSGSRHQVWVPQPYEFCGEPMFAAKRGSTREDDGYIITSLFNGRTKRTSLVILDAADVTRGPLARIDIRANVPHGLHGTWVPDLDNSV